MKLGKELEQMKRNWGKGIFLLLAATSISMTVPTAAITVSAIAVSAANEQAENAAANEAQPDAATTGSAVGEEANKTETENANKAEEAETTEGTKNPEESKDADEAEGTEAEDETEQDEQEEDSEMQEDEEYEEKTLTITKAGFVADTFNGVSAIYRKGSNDGSNATYSCAAFIKKYYKQIYKVSVHNLFAGSTPKTYEGKKIASAKSPQVGDIAYKSGHWAIVKKVNDNQTVTLIEQNWKWGGNQCKINRTVSTSSLKYFRLAK